MAPKAMPVPATVARDLGLALYRTMQECRLLETRAQDLFFEGLVRGTTHLGIGQEAVAAGFARAMRNDDYTFCTYRGHNHTLARGVPMTPILAELFGRATGLLGGKGGSMHLTSVEHGVMGSYAIVGAHLPIALGAAWSAQYRKSGQVAVCFFGDGATNIGAFHEALNIAAVWELPVIFVIENNGYGLSTPSSEQFRCKQFVDKALGYGVEGVKIDGNNILEVFHTTRQIAEQVRRKRKPVLLEAITFRMRGHEEASGVKYVPGYVLEDWKKRDPVDTFEQKLLKTGVLTEETAERTRGLLKEQIDTAWDAALAEPDVSSSESVELGDVYDRAAYNHVGANHAKTTTKRFVNAISDGLRQAMERDPKLVLMGQDIAEYGGVFKVTEGFVDQFGKERIRNTPLCESGIVGAALGLSICGRAAMVEMQFADFVSCGFNQIVNNLAKTHYRWGHGVNVTVRMPTGAGVGAGPFHSQSVEAWFTHVPGLRVVYPSSPFDAKGLLTTSLIEPNPVLFFEHKFLYRSIEGPVPDDYYTIPFGEAAVVQEGNDATVVTYGMGVHWAKEVAASISGVSIEIIDLRTLLPWDKETVARSVDKTGKCLVLHEATLVGGFGGEIATTVQEQCFRFLDAPVMRVGSLETPVPFNHELEQQFLARHGLHEKLKQLLDY